jgi:decaprenylphospho-beta-D-erythro-pentofuranosid-2-ulose 2-reductase
MSKILILGATSTIAENCARLWASRGEEIFLVGRNAEKLGRISNDLIIRGAQNIGTFMLDLDNYDGYPTMFNTAKSHLGYFDIVLIAHGSLSEQKKCEHDISLTMQEIRTNALSVIALLTIIANYFEIQKSGKIVVISSVAGDRGRASNYVYGSAKAMVTTFTSGLRQRLHQSNVSVITIKPGIVDSAMTAKMEKKWYWSRPDIVAQNILRAVDTSQHEIYVPSIWRIIMQIIKLLPSSIFIKIKI